MSNVESSKTLAGVGSILLILSVVPYAGAVLGIIGAVLLLIGLKGLATYYQDNQIYDNALMGVIFLIIALVVVAVAVFGAILLFISTIGFVGGIVILVLGLIVSFVFYLLAAMRLRQTFNTLAQKSGEQSFSTAGTMLWWGAILTIIFVGVILIFIAWIFSTIAFFSMRLQQQPMQPQQPYTAPPQAAGPPPASATVAQPAQPSRYCPYCGAPVAKDATFCPNCGKQLPPA
ncbi:MAG TPA: DUF996 domain-containing protein [Candidatus Limnocylindrales bacterium]|nr:DUF996 domain-containing protein [Candidatus Limnocylindrales bacterium]